MTNKVIINSIPERLGKFYERGDSIASVEHSEEIYLLEARYRSLLEQMTENENPKRWKELFAAWSVYENAANKAATTQRRSDMVKVQEALNKVDALIKSGYLYEYVAWQQVMEVLEQLRKTKETETKRRVQAASIISEKQVQQMIGFVISTIMNHVSDDQEREAILNKLKDINLY